MLLGLLGLTLHMFHGSPGFELATYLGFREPRTVVNLNESLIINGLNGMIWATVYGILGFVVDILKNRKK